MSAGLSEFEIIDAYGARWRYRRADGYSAEAR